MAGVEPSSMCRLAELRGLNALALLSIESCALADRGEEGGEITGVFFVLIAIGEEVLIILRDRNIELSSLASTKPCAPPRLFVNGKYY